MLLPPEIVLCVLDVLELEAQEERGMSLGGRAGAQTRLCKRQSSSNGSANEALKTLSLVSTDWNALAAPRLFSSLALRLSNATGGGDTYACTRRLEFARDKLVHRHGSSVRHCMISLGSGTDIHGGDNATSERRGSATTFENEEDELYAQAERARQAHLASAILETLPALRTLELHIGDEDHVGVDLLDGLASLTSLETLILRGPRGDTGTHRGASSSRRLTAALCDSLGSAAPPPVLAEIQLHHLGLSAAQYATVIRAAASAEPPAAPKSLTLELERDVWLAIASTEDGDDDDDNLLAACKAITPLTKLNLLNVPRGALDSIDNTWRRVLCPATVLVVRPAEDETSARVPRGWMAAIDESMLNDDEQLRALAA